MPSREIAGARAHLQTAAAMTEPPADAPRPKELYIDEQWDRFIDLTVRRTVYGTLAGGVAALLLARARREFRAHRASLLTFLQILGAS